MNTTNEITIRLPDETVNYLQRLDYEVAGLQVLHTHALNAGTPLDKRMEIRREFQETFAEYQMAKSELWAGFAPRFPNAKRWWVDFQTGELHVETSNTSPLVGEVAPRSGDEGGATPKPFPPSVSLTADSSPTKEELGGGEVHA